jgi:hypothetical protein
MRSSICFGCRYDVERLVADLKIAEQAGKAHLHFSTAEHDGGWSAIPLVSLGGGVEADSLRYQKGIYKKTPVLERCPYFEEIVESFRCRWQRIRLMRLEPGTNIHEHRDPGDSWALGQVRMHVPIITHDEVYFYLDGQRLIMQPGELWYCDFSRPHRVSNRSPIARVHLVLDLVANDWLRGMFPTESLAERVGNWVYWGRFHANEGLRYCARSAGFGKLRQRLRRKPLVRSPYGDRQLTAIREDPSIDKQMPKSVAPCTVRQAGRGHEG